VWIVLHSNYDDIICFMHCSALIPCSVWKNRPPSFSTFLFLDHFIKMSIQLFHNFDPSFISFNFCLNGFFFVKIVISNSLLKKNDDHKFWLIW
jgi:hypothetical protein